MPLIFVASGVIEMRNCNKKNIVKTDMDYLILYDAKDIQEIFALESISGARKLMNSPGFPVMKVGRKLLVTKGNLVEFIKQHETSKIFF